MSRQPVVSTDSVAQDQIRAFVDRILRMKEEAKAINDDIREIYAEAKGNGFDKTVLGKLVSYVGRREKSAAAMEEADALFDLYLAAYDGTPSRTHAHAREDDYEPAPADEATLTPVKAGQASQQGEGGGEDAPASLATPVLLQEGGADAEGLGGATREQGSGEPSQPLLPSGRVENKPDGPAVTVADTNSEPGNGRAGETPVVAPRQAGEASSDASPVAANHNFTRIPVLGEVR